MNPETTGAEAILELAQIGHQCPSPRDQEFASSLVHQYRKRRGNLSDKQWPWVYKLLAKAKGLDKKPLEQVEVGSMAGVLALFAKAKESRLKFPKLVLMTPAGEIKVYQAGAKAKVPGSITVVGTVRDAETNRFPWYGRILADGKFEHGQKATPELIAFLTLLSADAGAAIAASGKVAGSCGCCGLPLTDPRSVTVGYGQTCAEKWGLPWGGEPRRRRRAVA